MDRAPRTFVLTEGLREGLRKPVTGHKYTHGHTLIMSGGPGRSGAARLAARGALRVGAGLVTLAVPAAAQPEVAAQITAIMLRSLHDPADLAAILADTRINALCLGPGLGVSDVEAGYLDMVLRTNRATVLDADALTLLARDDGLRRALHPGCLLTPHDGEFLRLFPDCRDDLAHDVKRAAALRMAAVQLGCAILLKGPATLVALPDGQVWRHEAAMDGALAWLATAGAGDVLAGFIVGLLARGFAAGDAANLGTLLHAQAARRFGPGLIAEDLPEALPGLFRNLGL
ncbi:MAG: NAD(P)H-hydrate dehydratase [Rhodobacterales bacterium]|nr:NAD(P)H-hydrate dehydratase [Rhodobacterales bacterium]MDX5391498.1 NAD(P)H-hydrate dehydratase [Rhodobacterales bacterium]MDX5491198.1 NAD(P)H-hydrate dehydratase [Rhodobacterales bacterium]